MQVWQVTKGHYGLKASYKLARPTFTQYQCLYQISSGDTAEKKIMTGLWAKRNFPHSQITFVIIMQISQYLRTKSMVESA